MPNIGPGTFMKGLINRNSGNDNTDEEEGKNDAVDICIKNNGILISWIFSSTFYRDCKFLKVVWTISGLLSLCSFYLATHI